MLGLATVVLLAHSDINASTKLDSTVLPKAELETYSAFDAIEKHFLMMSNAIDVLNQTYYDVQNVNMRLSNVLNDYDDEKVRVRLNVLSARIEEAMAYIYLMTNAVRHLLFFSFVAFTSILMCLSCQRRTYTPTTSETVAVVVDDIKK